MLFASRQHQDIKAASPFFPEVIGAWNAVSFTDQTDIPVNEFLDASSKILPFLGSRQLLSSGVPARL
jgi:hypothetical protein